MGPARRATGSGSTIAGGQRGAVAVIFNGSAHPAGEPGFPNTAVTFLLPNHAGQPIRRGSSNAGLIRLVANQRIDPRRRCRPFTLSATSGSAGGHRDGGRSPTALACPATGWGCYDCGRQRSSSGGYSETDPQDAAPPSGSHLAAVPFQPCRRRPGPITCVSSNAAYALIAMSGSIYDHRPPA